MQHVSWKKLLILAVSSSFLMGVSGCPSDAPEFNWNPDLYNGDSRTQMLQGSRDRFACTHVRFDEMTCMHNSEIAKARQAYFDVINQCEKWKSASAKAEGFE
jgi:hypothetical protein